jgi:predicted metal-dependent hydrolase
MRHDVRYLEYLAQSEDLSVPWCNSSATMTSTMEAISFVTPVVERFVIGTIAEVLATKPARLVELRLRAFVREESNHSWMHIKFNASLLAYLGAPPPGLKLVQAALNGARRRVSLSSRLLLVAALEHFAAVMSKGYLHHEGGWDFRSATAKMLFAHHAREEIAHRSVAFDLWSSRAPTGRSGRTFAVLAILTAGFLYLCAAVPWILYRKSGDRVDATLVALAGAALDSDLKHELATTMASLFTFTRGGYHPDRAVGSNFGGESR